MNTSPILYIQDLTIAYQQNSGDLEAVRHASLSLSAGETCGLVGESGSGKTTLALAVMHYLPEDGRVVSGKIHFAGQELVEKTHAEMRQIWGSRIAMVPQETQGAFNPAIRLGEQTAEILRHHLGLDADAAHDRVLDLYERVRLGDPRRVADSFPHQLSGGMLQRVATAMAISTEPDLLVLDEPTSSLDVTTQAAMLDLYRDLIRDFDTAVLYITHNLGVMAQITNRVAVMYAGELIEDAPTEALFRQPLHPYTRGLMDCIPKLGRHKGDVRLRPIQDRIPPLDDLPKGCVFRPRCPLVIEVCHEYPPLYPARDRRHSRCHRWEEILNDKITARQPSPDVPEPERDEGGHEAVLNMQDVTVFFREDASLLKTLQGEKDRQIKAVKGVTLSVTGGQTLGLVGESGSGKTTLARAVVGLDPYTDGEISLNGLKLTPELSKRTADMVCCLQIIFQDPDEALNPYLSVGETLKRPVMRLRGETRKSADQIVIDLLNAVNLSAEYVHRLPGQLSGGEKQRIALARAFAPNPDLLIADEPVSSLDVSVQASILNLFDTLQARHEIGILFISHDLAVVGYLADQVAVIYLGQFMEVAPVADLYDSPHHPYTEALLLSVPLVDPDTDRRKIRLEGDVPSPSEKILGCPFHTRCHRILGDICVEQPPPWQEVPGTEKRYFCHIPPNELREKQDEGVRLPGSQVH